MAQGIRLGLLRPADLLAIELELVNLAPSPDRSRLVRTDPDLDPLVIVHLPPQGLAEASFAGPPPQPPIRTVLSGPSRLVFRIPGDELALTTQALLDWSSWVPVLAPTALPRGTAPSAGIPAPAAPTAAQTAVEFPWRVLLSPDASSAWRTDNGATASRHQQLWSAVLTPAEPGRPGLARPPGDVRALGSIAGPEPFQTSLDSVNRADIVSLTSNFHLAVPGAGRFTPIPLRAHRLELTALGADVELEGSWDYPLLPPQEGFQPIGLRQYQHVAALGRDTFVRTVEIGWLCGTGHMAVVVKTIQRLPDRLKLVATTAEGPQISGNGYLIRSYEVIVQQPVLDYSALAPAYAHGGLEFPLRSIELTTRCAQVAEVSQVAPSWLVRPDGGRLAFQAIGTDLAGARVHFSLPLMFVPYRALGDHRAIRAAFHSAPAAVRDAQRIEVDGQQLTVAPAGERPGATVLTTSAITYDIEQPPVPGDPPPEHAMIAGGAPPGYVPRFLPRIALMTASSPAVDDLMGGSRPVDLGWDPTYLAAGFDGARNRAQTFVGFVADLPLVLPSQRGGGLASTDATARALSRSMGPVAAPEKLQQGTVDLSAFARTKLLGTIPVTSLVPDVMAFDAAAAGEPPTPAQLDDPHFRINPPRLATTREPAGAARPDLVETRFTWKPPLRTHKVLGLLTLDLAEADLLLDTTSRMVRSGPTSSVTHGRLRNVGLTFADALRAGIAELSFRAEAGRKTEFGASQVEITFLGPLAFVNALQSILPESGFDDPPFVTTDAQGVVTGYTLGVPSIGVGIFAIQNISISAALSIPFTDRPAGIRFAISERHKPFLVTVSLFGGGGFFAVGVSANGLESVEAAVEFGGSIALNLGVASGGVYVMAGIYFGMKGSAVELTGYLRCGGHLSVLGLISISLEFYLAFTYRKKAVGSEVWGQASLTVSVKVAFFSTSVTLSVERRFAGSDGDPSFTETITPRQWAGYLQAFA